VGLFVSHRASPWTGYAMQEAKFDSEWAQHFALIAATADDNLVGTTFDAPDAPAGNMWFDDWRVVTYNPAP